MSTNDDNLMSHSYDGIQEYDNPAPGWWSLIFLATIVFSVGYWIYYHQGPGKSIHEEYARDWKHNRKVWAEYQKKLAASAPKTDEALLAKLAKDPATLEIGKKVFMIHCQSCHTPDGKGLVGPNLTDDYQIHGSTRMDMYTVVLNGGRKDKGMISWRPVLKPKELIAVTVYVSNMRHKNIKGKPPEGKKVEPFPN